MGNCCSEDNTPYDAEFDVEKAGPGLEVTPMDANIAVAPPLYDDSLSAATPSPAAPPSPAPVETTFAPPPEPVPAPVPEPAAEAQTSSFAASPAPAYEASSALLGESATPASTFQLGSAPAWNPSSGGGGEEEGTKLKPGAKEEEDLSALPPAETKMTGNTGFALVYSPIAGGTLSAKWVDGNKPSGTVAFLRIEAEVDDSKLNNQPMQCGRNVKTDWMLLAKALAVYLKQCWAYSGELELLPEFNTLLPRRAIFVFHSVDLAMHKFVAPTAFETPNDNWDACAIMPHLSETFKGQNTLKLNAFLEKAVRRGATVRF